MPADVLPYLVPRPGTVTWEPWLLYDGDDWTPMPDAVDGWDPGTDLRVMRRAHVDADRLTQETGLDIADVALAVSWTSSTTDMTEAVAPVPFGVGGLAVADVPLIGERVSGVLTLRSTVSVIRQPRRRALGVASIVGSVLVQDTQRVVLENVSSMFPVHEIDFAHTRLSPTASWHLETTADLTAPFYGTFRVLINSQDRELCGAVMRGARDKRQQALLDELQAGVASLLLELALHMRDEIGERDEWPVDSVGDVLARTLHSSPLAVAVPPSPQDLADYRTQISGAVRNAGKGRIFR
jgi:hypothetical protein